MIDALIFGVVGSLIITKIFIGCYVIFCFLIVWVAIYRLGFKHRNNRD